MKAVWAQDANAECAEAIKAKSFFISPAGKNIRSMNYEVPQTFYDLTKDPMKDGKFIVQDAADALINRPYAEWTFDFIIQLIGCHMVGDKNIRTYNPYDKLIIPAGKLGCKQRTETTLGRLIVYKIMVEGCGLSGNFPYDRINRVFTSKELGKFEQEVSDLLINDTIDTDQFAKYINHRDWLGLQIHGLVTVSFTSKTIKTPTSVKKRRAELFAKHKAELDAGDINVANKIENELINLMLNEIKDDPGYDIYASGARGSVDNHMKNMFIMRGGIPNPITGKHDIVQASFSEGIRKDDFTPAGNSVVQGAYFKSVATADSGSLSKQLMAALQSEVIGEDGSDCGTKETLDMYIDSPSDFINRYIKEGNKTVFLDPKVVKNYVGKTVKMYTPMYCKRVKNGCLCEKCAGKQVSKFPGLDTNKLSSVLVNMGCNFSWPMQNLSNCGDTPYYVWTHF